MNSSIWIFCDILYKDRKYVKFASIQNKVNDAVIQ